MLIKKSITYLKKYIKQIYKMPNQKIAKATRAIILVVYIQLCGEEVCIMDQNDDQFG